MAAKQRIEQQPAWVLHTLPWRETSLIVEVFTRRQGRLAMVAKGARRPHSVLRGVLMAFQPLLLDWSGGGEVKTLVRAEWQGGQPLLTGQALLCAYYLNELLVCLTAREDAHPALFDAYGAALAALGSGERIAPILRRFELALLHDLGYGPVLDGVDEAGMPLDPERHYVYLIERGPVESAALQAEDSAIAAGQPRVGGQTLLDLAAGDLSRVETLLQSKLLLRTLINHYLGGRALQSRRILKELAEL